MIMGGGAADGPQRSSSPLKRRASSMDEDMDTGSNEDVDMITVPAVDTKGDAQDVESMGSPKSDFSPKAGTPPLAEQIKTIETLLKAFSEQPLKEGDKAYLVSRQWLEKAQGAGENGKKKDPSESTAAGPIDNSDIIQGILKDVDDKDFVRLKPGMGLEHYQLFSTDAWDLVLTWYGLADGQLPIERYAHNTAPDGNFPHVEFEIHPPVFTVHRLWAATSPIPIDQKLKATNPPPIQIACSTSCRTMLFLKKLKQLADINMDRKVRVWRVTRDINIKTTVTAATPEPVSPQGAALTPPDSPKEPSAPQDPWGGLLLEASQLMALTKGTEREELNSIKDETNNEKYNGRSTLAMYSLQADDTLVLDENVDGHIYVSVHKEKGGAKDKSTAAKGNSSNLTVATKSAPASGRTSPALSGPSTRGRVKQRSGRTTGCVGLSNLGNTCYMNSALQCVRSVEELTKYFLVGEANKEINTDNPLAHNGDVARAYESLLREIYRDNAPGSIAPRQFKSVIGRYAPAFSGYGQQDSQEFVGFLLDGLQEDLSRIKKKPYIEKPDSTDDMINNPEAIREMAAKVWDITKKRDDSVIADLFTGMYKSTLVCPFCHKVSITFDPFNNLTLPLPLHNSWSRTVRYLPLNDPPVELHVEVDKASSIKGLREFIAAKVGVPPERIIGAEEYKNRFFTIYEDGDCVSEKITNGDQACFFELESAPTNMRFTKPKKKQRSMLIVNDSDEDDSPTEWDNPMAERLVVPVLHRFSPECRAKPPKTVTPPHFIVVTREEAWSEDSIRRKVLEKIASLSTWREFATDDVDTADNTDLEMVNAPTSDADSSGDSKVVAKSVEGEEDLVDVSTTKSGASDGQSGVKPVKVFAPHRPKWVNPNEHLPPMLQQLFQMHYFSESGSGIPSGWQFNFDNPLPTLESRAPPVDEEMLSPRAENDSSSEGESSPHFAPPMSASEVTRMGDDTSEDELATPTVIKPRGKPPKIGGRRQNRRAAKTYSKKGKARRDKPANGSAAANSFEPLTEDSPPPTNTYGPLIRLGEGIVVDWTPETWEAVYGANERDEFLWDNIVTITDPALAEKKRQRAQRKKNGISLDDCLDEFEKQEVLSEQDTWYCPRCKEHVRASKKFDLWKTPDILVVHLKRFSSSGYRRDKLDTLVDFPIEGLDLTRRVIDKHSGKQEVYDLIGIDDHWGGLGGGHYTAFAKNFIDNEWYEYNDACVSKTKDLGRMVTSSAYLLFYRRRSDVPLGGPRFQQIIELYDRSSESPDEDASDSGEGRRLDTGSSQRGSSSALAGAEATRQLGSSGYLSMVDAAVDDQLPSYEDAVDVPEVWSGDTVRGSIEDEGIGGMETQSFVQQDWNWSNLVASSVPKTGSMASDEAEMNSSLGVGGGAGSTRDNSGRTSPFQAFEDNDVEAQQSAGLVTSIEMDDMHPLTWKGKEPDGQLLHTIPANVGGDDASSDRAIDIHVDDDKIVKPE